MSTYISISIGALIIGTPLAMGIFGLYYIYVKLILNKEIELDSLDSLCKFLWLVVFMVVLFVTGIFESVLSGNFRTDYIANGIESIDLYIFREGLTTATILNLILFIPFGIFTNMIIKRILSSVLICFVFSFSIEFVQLFTGRFVQLEDLLMNTVGGIIGCILGVVILKCKSKGWILTEF